MFNRARFNLARFNVPTDPGETIFIRELLIETVDNFITNGENVHFSANMGMSALSSLYGAAATKHSASLLVEMLSQSELSALVYSVHTLEETFNAAALISENIHIVDALDTEFFTAPQIGKNTPVVCSFAEALSQYAFPSKNYLQPTVYWLTILDGHVTTTIFDTLYIAFSAAVPPGSTLVLDSDNYVVLLDGENATAYHTGEWLRLTRDIQDLLIDCPTEHALEAEILYIERYL